MRYLYQGKNARKKYLQVIFSIHLSTLFSVYSSSYSSSQPASLSQWNAHSREVVFHTLQKFQRGIRICPLIIKTKSTCTRYGCSVPRVLLYFSSVTLIPILFPPPPLTRPFPPPDQFPPVPTTTYSLVPLVPFPIPHTGLTVIA